MECFNSINNQHQEFSYINNPTIGPGSDRNEKSDDVGSTKHVLGDYGDGIVLPGVLLMDPTLTQCF